MRARGRAGAGPRPERRPGLRAGGGRRGCGGPGGGSWSAPSTGARRNRCPPRRPPPECWQCAPPLRAYPQCKDPQINAHTRTIAHMRTHKHTHRQAHGHDAGKHTPAILNVRHKCWSGRQAAGIRQGCGKRGCNDVLGPTAMPCIDEVERRRAVFGYSRALCWRPACPMPRMLAPFERPAAAARLAWRWRRRALSSCWWAKARIS